MFQLKHWLSFQGERLLSDAVKYVESLAGFTKSVLESGPWLYEEQEHLELRAASET